MGRFISPLSYLERFLHTHVLHSWQTHQWQPTPGKVIAAWITEQRVKTRTLYQPRVRYEYVVNHQWYRSERICVGDRWGGSNHPEATQQLRPYSPGTEITVYYNPRHPHQAVLQLRTHPAVYGLLAGGIFFLGISLFIATAILPSAMHTCGITPTSTQAQPGSPVWCQSNSLT